MNKLIKGSIAGAAGIALLLGGAGTLAYWNDSASVGNAAVVSSGKLDVVAGTGAWTVQVGTGAPTALTASQLAAYRIVPGNKLVYTETLTVDAVGDNLKFTLGETVSTAVTSTISGATVTPEFAVTKGGAAVSTFTGLTAGSYTVVAKITVDFPSTVANQVGQSSSLNLSGATVTVTQTP